VSPLPPSTETTGMTTTPPVRPAEPFDPDAVLARITALTDFGPRDATSRAHARAAAYVAAELERLGYRVRLQDVPVPAGTSWGIRVPAGTSANVVGEPEGFDAATPHVVIGAHLDTVPQAPGAEDNASGVAVLLELARMLREQPAGLPVRLVAFGAEESRGTGPSRYAFGSRHYVAELGAVERAAVRAMLSLDRVGVRAATVPVCFGDRATRRLSDAVRAASPRALTSACRNRASDHVSFEAVGIPAARIGSVPYPAYHSERDVPSVIDRRQLARSGAVVWSWLRSLD
jgi:Zn-dependent M28 family amino/carboxypeptidase